MRRVKLVVVFLSLAFQMTLLKAATPEIVPCPKTYQASGVELPIENMAIYIPDGNRQCEIAAEELTLKIKKLGGTAGMIRKEATPDAAGIFILTVKDELSKIFKRKYNLKVSESYPGEQGYIIHISSNQVVIVGSDNVGALYGAMTLRQMIQNRNGRIIVPQAKVIDWPDFRIRTGISFWRSLEKFTKGEKNKLEGVKACMNWMLRFKMNHLNDYQVFDARNVTPGMRKYWAEANKYAIERGIMPQRMVWVNLYGWWMTKKNAILPKGVKSRKDWSCVFEARAYREHYYCWSDDKAAKARIEAEADLVKECNFKMFMYHPVDGGGLSNPELWNNRCSECKKRWKDDERWKATVHQLGMWNRIIKRKTPDLIMIGSIYPYAASYIDLKTKENSAIWKLNVIDYWEKINANLDPDIYFVTWFCKRRTADRHRSALMGRPISYGDCHPKGMGVFSTHSRFYVTDFYGGRDMIRTTGGNTLHNKWMFYLNASEFAWNTTSPGCSEFEDNMIFYDSMKDHLGPEIIIKQWLPKACRLFWGNDLGKNMAQFYGSGIMPRYILNPGASMTIINKYRLDPLADTDPHAKKKVSKIKQPSAIADNAAMMKKQVEISQKCLNALSEVYEKSLKLEKYKRKLFMKYYRRAPYWVTIAQARYDMRIGDDLMRAGKNKDAAEIYTTGLKKYEKNLAKAKEISTLIKNIPDLENSFLESRIALDLKEKFTRKVESAETILKPRRVGRFVKVAIYKGLGARGTKEFFDQFKNVKAKIIDNLNLKILDEYDCLFMLRDHSIDRFDYFENVRNYVVKGGGGVVFEHTFCGHKRFETKTPFPEVCQYSKNRYNNFDRQIYIVSNPLFTGIKPKTAYKNMYRDFFSPILGEAGFVLAVDKDKHPVAVAGKVGLGKVVFDGLLSKSTIGNSWANEEKLLFGFNALIAEKSVEWFTGVKLERK